MKDKLPSYIYILDYSDSTICKITLTEKEKEMEIEDIIEQHGVNINTASWMLSNADIDNIIII